MTVGHITMLQFQVQRICCELPCASSVYSAVSSLRFRPTLAFQHLFDDSHSDAQAGSSSADVGPLAGSGPGAHAASRSDVRGRAPGVPDVHNVEEIFNSTASQVQTARCHCTLPSQVSWHKCRGCACSPSSYAELIRRHAAGRHRRNTLRRRKSCWTASSSTSPLGTTIAPAARTWSCLRGCVFASRWRLAQLS